ncbi:hypothetical protein [Tenacibaculum sp. MAR_2009_124]|nr:hypothetical protein [Tenacibaculum sp. MAR_2009_124]
MIKLDSDGDGIADSVDGLDGFGDALTNRYRWRWYRRLYDLRF